MGKPYCDICENHHWPRDGHIFKSSGKKDAPEKAVRRSAVRADEPAADKRKSPESSTPDNGDEGAICPICKGDPTVLEDAERWRRIREKQRVRMKKWREKQK